MTPEEYAYRIRALEDANSALRAKLFDTEREWGACCKHCNVLADKIAYFNKIYGETPMETFRILKEQRAEIETLNAKFAKQRRDTTAAFKWQMEQYKKVLISAGVMRYLPPIKEPQFDYTKWSELIKQLRAVPRHHLFDSPEWLGEYHQSFGGKETKDETYRYANLEPTPAPYDFRKALDDLEKELNENERRNRQEDNEE